MHENTSWSFKSISPNPASQLLRSAILKGCFRFIQTLHHIVSYCIIYHMFLIQMTTSKAKSAKPHGHTAATPPSRGLLEQRPATAQCHTQGWHHDQCVKPWETTNQSAWNLLVTHRMLWTLAAVALKTQTPLFGTQNPSWLNKILRTGFPVWPVPAPPPPSGPSGFQHWLWFMPNLSARSWQYLTKFSVLYTKNINMSIQCSRKSWVQCVGVSYIIELLELVINITHRDIIMLTNAF